MRKPRNQRETGALDFSRHSCIPYLIPARSADSSTDRLTSSAERSAGRRATPVGNSQAAGRPRRSVLSISRRGWTCRHRRGPPEIARSSGPLGSELRFGVVVARNRLPGRRLEVRPVPLGHQVAAVLDGGLRRDGILNRSSTRSHATHQHLCGRRLYDVGQELGWDDVHLGRCQHVQNRPGSLRIYHFRGFCLYVTLEYMQQGLTDNMLLERGSDEEKLQARDLLRISLHNPP